MLIDIHLHIHRVYIIIVPDDIALVMRDEVYPRVGDVRWEEGEEGMMVEGVTLSEGERGEVGGAGSEVG